MATIGTRTRRSVQTLSPLTEFPEKDRPEQLKNDTRMAQVSSSVPIHNTDESESRPVTSEDIDAKERPTAPNIATVPKFTFLCTDPMLVPNNYDLTSKVAYFIDEMTATLCIATVSCTRLDATRVIVKTTTPFFIATPEYCSRYAGIVSQQQQLASMAMIPCFSTYSRPTPFTAPGAPSNSTPFTSM